MGRAPAEELLASRWLQYATMLSISGFSWAEPLEIWNLPVGDIVQVLLSMGAPLAWLLAIERAIQRNEEYQPWCIMPAGHCTNANILLGIPVNVT